MAPTSTEWVWDEDHRVYRYWSVEQATWVLEDGRRLSTRQKEQTEAPQSSKSSPQPSDAQIPRVPAAFISDEAYLQSSFPQTTGEYTTDQAQQQHVDLPAAIGNLSIEEPDTRESPNDDNKIPLGPATRATSGAYQPREAERSESVVTLNRKLHPGFKHRHPSFFKPGLVIRTPIAEVVSYANRNSDNPSIFRDPQFEEEFILKLQWLVVVRVEKLYCVCLPINTYGKRGVSKKDIVKKDHSIVYTTRKPPKPLLAELPQPPHSKQNWGKGKSNRNERSTEDVEKGMLPPIRIKRLSGEDEMHPMSRVNYNRPYPLNINVKVYNYGMIHKNDERRFFSQYQEILSESLPRPISLEPVAEADNTAETSGYGSQNQGAATSATSYGASHSTGHNTGYNQSYGGVGSTSARADPSYNPPIIHGYSASANQSASVAPQSGGWRTGGQLPGVSSSHYNRIAGGSVLASGESRSSYAASAGSYQRHPQYGEASSSRGAYQYSTGHAAHDVGGKGDEDDDEDDEDDDEDEDDEEQESGLQNYEQTRPYDGFAQDDDDDDDDDEDEDEEDS